MPGSPSSATRSRTRSRRRCRPRRSPSSGSGEWSYEAIEVVPEQLRGAGRLAARRRLRRRQRDRPAQARGARARRRGLARRRGRSAPPTRSPSPTAACIADNTDAAGLIAAIGAPARRARGRSCSAPGGSARAAVWALREAGAEVSIWNRTAAAGEALAAELGVAQGTGGSPAQAPSTCSSTRPRSGSSRQATRPPAPEDLKALPVDADSIGATTSRGGPRLRVARDGARLPRTGARRTRDRRARGPGPPGSRVASDLDRARAPARDDAKGGTRRTRPRWMSDPAHLRPVPGPSAEATARELDERRRRAAPRADPAARARQLGDVPHRRHRRARLRDPRAGRRGDRGGADRRPLRRRAAGRAAADRRRPALARGRRALRPRPRRPERATTSTWARRTCSRSPPRAATRRSRSATSTQKTLLVAIVDPANVLAIDDIQMMTGLNCRMAVAAADDIEALIRRLNSLETRGHRGGRRGRGGRSSSARSPSCASPPTTRR